MTFTGTEALMIAWASATIGALIGVVVLALCVAGKREDEARELVERPQPVAWMFVKDGCRPQVLTTEPDESARKWFADTFHNEVPLYAAPLETSPKLSNEPEYDHTQDGTANFERALAYARTIQGADQ